MAVTLLGSSAGSHVSAWPRRLPLFGVGIDAVTRREAVSLVCRWMREEWRECRLIVTPNVDHVVLLQENERLREVYRQASLVVADGWPVVAASRLLRRPLPERVTGSDLVPELLASATADDPWRVFLLGAAPGVGLRAAERIQRDWPHVQVVGVASPPLGFELHEEENELLLRQVEEASPDLLVVGLGAPKQELWVHAYRSRLRAKVAIGAGATIDFLAGEKRRAPAWMQRTGLEWLHRMASEPRRLLRRYARDAWQFPCIVWREYRKSRRFSD